MNQVTLIGRLTKDPEIRYSSGEKQTAIASFTVAVNRATKGEADFIGCKAFGKTAELIEKYFHKGQRIALNGRIQTGSYKNKDGNTVYTTDVIVSNVEFIDSKNEESSAPKNDGIEPMIPEGFMKIEEDDLPF